MRKLNCYLSGICFVFLYGCSGEVLENNEIGQTKTHEYLTSDNTLLPEKQKNIEQIIKSFGFKPNYSRNKCINWAFTEVLTADRKFELSVDFINKIGISELKSAFEVDDSFYPVSFVWMNYEILVFEYLQICPLDIEDMKNDDYSVYRTVVLNTQSNKFHYFDLYKNNEKGGERISIQKGDNIIFYDIEGIYDSKKEVYHYSKYEYNLLSNKQRFILKESTDSDKLGDLNLDEYLCEKGGVSSVIME